MLDLLFILTFLIGVIKGLRNGLVMAIFAIIGWALGLYAALKFSDLAAEFLKDYLPVGPRWLSIIAFIVVFILVSLLVSLGGKIVEKTVDIAMLGWLNRIGGIFFYIVLYTLIFSVIIYFAHKVKLLSDEATSSSKVYSVLEPIIIKLKQLL